MPENSVERQLVELTKVVYELKGAVEKSAAHAAPCNFLGDLEKKINAEIKNVDDARSRDVRELHNLFRQHKDENHSSKMLIPVLINLGTMAATIGAMFLMMKG